MFVFFPYQNRSCVVFVLFYFSLPYMFSLLFLFCLALSCLVSSLSCFVMYNLADPQNNRVMVGRPVLFLSCLVNLRNTKLCACGIRVRPSTHVVPHDSCGPWKHQLARSGFVELIPVLMWFLSFSMAFVPLTSNV